MATIKTKDHANQAKTVHAGVNQVVCRLSLSATFSAGDVYYFGRLPDGAVVTEIVYLPGPAASDVAVAAFGVNANSLSTEALLVSDTYSQGIVTSGIVNALGHRGAALYSLSDERIVRYIDVTFRPTAGVSVGHQADLVITYNLDDANKV
jgi:hypothetical protein